MWDVTWSILVITNEYLYFILDCYILGHGLMESSRIWDIQRRRSIGLWSERTTRRSLSISGSRLTFWQGKPEWPVKLDVVYCTLGQKGLRTCVRISVFLLSISLSLSLSLVSFVLYIIGWCVVPFPVRLRVQTPALVPVTMSHSIVFLLVQWTRRFTVDPRNGPAR